jgi:hypothetical protein
LSIAASSSSGHGHRFSGERSSILPLTPITSIFLGFQKLIATTCLWPSKWGGGL